MERPMVNLKTFAASLTLAIISTSVYAADTPIVGTVQSKCSIYTDRQGVYGNPLPNKLSTEPSDGGVNPVIRYDVAQGDYYIAKLTWPNNFSSSPSLADAVDWDGEVSVSQVSDTLMSDYETGKIEYNNVTEFDMTVAGSVWFEIDSTIEYGFGKSFPAGSYTTVVTAECIAK